MRELEPKLRDYFESRLRLNGLFASAVARGDARLIFRLAAESLVGIREVGGNNSGPLVELMQKTIGDAGREPWCMGLVQSCLAFAELKTGQKSPVIAGEHCLTVWQDTPKIHRVQSIPAPGAICIWRHEGTSNGHTGITISQVTKNGVELVEGNTESGLVGGHVERDGGGVYHTDRSILATGSMKVMGFLKPF